MFIFLRFCFGDLEVLTSQVSKATNLLPSPVSVAEGISTHVLKGERIGEDLCKNRSIFFNVFPSNIFMRVLPATLFLKVLSFWNFKVESEMSWKWVYLFASSSFQCVWWRNEESRFSFYPCAPPYLCIYLFVCF